MKRFDGHACPWQVQLSMSILYIVCSGRLG